MDIGMARMPTLAQHLRREPTVAEIRFWRILHPLRSAWHFRKQSAIGPFVVDFVSHRARLVIEIDGDTHFVGNGPARDARRNTFLVSQGYRVLHISNHDVMHNAEGVYHAVAQALAAKPPSELR
jgi:very-short-patch-repair endonuclease